MSNPSSNASPVACIRLRSHCHMMFARTLPKFVCPESVDVTIERNPNRQGREGRLEQPCSRVV